MLSLLDMLMMSYNETVDGRFLVQTLLNTWPGMEIQPLYEVPIGLRVEIRMKSAMINTELERLPPRQWVKVGPGSSKVADNKKRFWEYTGFITMNY